MRKAYYATAEVKVTGEFPPSFDIETFLTTLIKESLEGPLASYTGWIEVTSVQPTGDDDGGDTLSDLPQISP